MMNYAYFGNVYRTELMINLATFNQQVTNYIVAFNATSIAQYKPASTTIVSDLHKAASSDSRKPGKQ